MLYDKNFSVKLQIDIIIIFSSSYNYSFYNAANFWFLSKISVLKKYINKNGHKLR